jgi:hypothetical protein
MRTSITRDTWHHPSCKGRKKERMGGMKEGRKEGTVVKTKKTNKQRKGQGWKGRREGEGGQETAVKEKEAK